MEKPHAEGGTDMETIEIITAFALSLSFLLLLWAIKGLLLRPAIRGHSLRVTAVITADANSKDLEREVTNLRWLREDGRLNADIIIVDAGMDSETAELAGSLQRRDPSLMICRPDEIANIITRGIGNGAER